MRGADSGSPRPARDPDIGRPIKNLCSDRCRDGISAVPLCLNPLAGVPLEAGNGGVRPRLLPPSGGFGRQLAGAFGCDPSRVLAADGTPLCSYGSETGSNGMGRIAVYRMRFDLSIYFPPSHPVCQPAQPLRPRQLSAGGERPTCVVPVPYVSIIPREGHIHGGSKTRSSTAFCKCFLPGKRIGTNLPGADVKTGSSLVRTTPRQLTPSTLQGNPKKGPAPNRPDFFQTGGAAGNEESGRTRGHRRYRRFPPPSPTRDGRHAPPR
jgi:hypothetical protein